MTLVGQVRRGVLATLLVLCALAAPAWADDEDEGGGGAPPPAADEPPAADDPPGGDKPDEAADKDDAAGSAAGSADDKDDDAAGSAAGSADADDDKDGDKDGDAAGSAAADDDEDGDAAGSADAAGDKDGDTADAAAEVDTDGDGTPDAEDAEPNAAELDDEGVPYLDDDADGDGVVEADELAEAKEFDEAFADVPDVITDDALDARAEDAELVPSMDAATFRKLVGLARAKVMPRLEEKIERKTAKKMTKFAMIVVGFSALGLLLLLSPLVLAKKYPGKAGLLFKYAAIAAATFVITVNLFGLVLLGLREVQGLASRYTNPQLAIAGGLFDTLDEHADEFLITGKELFAPSLEQMNAKDDEPPVVTVLENGKKIIEDAQVFVSIGNFVKGLDWLFGMLPIVLTAVTLLLFILALKPTLIEIIKLPAQMAAGQAAGSQDVVKSSMRRVWTELKAAVCTLGGLLLVTVLGAYILGQIVGPALHTLLEYFSLTVQYLQFVTGASSGFVFMTLFAVTMFLGLNLAAVILSSAFFLGKLQKVFQNHFTDGVPLANHKKFFVWGSLSVVWVQLFPLLFMLAASPALAKINDWVIGSETDAEAVSWKGLMLAGPLFLVIGFLVFFWAARALKALGFLLLYQVKPKPPKAAKTAPSA